MSNHWVAGRYRLDALIGQGSMGTVWRAHDERLDRDVAVKLVEASPSPNLAGGTPAALERFRREVTATAALDHPAIVSVLDAGVDGSTAYLVMELLGGESVAALLARNGPLPLDLALWIAAEVAGALTAGHAAGIVHRDIKPANVMVNGPRVTVLDFGVAHLQDAEMTLTEPETAIGTAAYMAPEQAAGERVGPGADTYALGCLIMAMVTGRPPYLGDNPIAVAAQQISAPVPRLSARTSVPVALDALVTAMLSKKTFDRPDVAAVQNTLVRLRADRDPPMTGPVPASGAVTDVAAAAATAVLAGAAAAPHPTTVLPAAPATPSDPEQATPLVAVTPGRSSPGLPPPIRSAPQARTGYQTYKRNPMPGEHAGWWKVPLAVVVVLALGAIAFVWASGAGHLTLPGAADPVGTPAPSATARSSAPATSASSRPPTTASSRPPSTTVPSGASAIALQAAVKAVSGVLDALPDSKAKTQLVTTWNTSSPQILAGKQAAKRVQEFSDMVIGYQQTGALSIPEALSILAALEGVKLLI